MHKHTRFQTKLTSTLIEIEMQLYALIYFHYSNYNYSNVCDSCNDK